MTEGPSMQNVQSAEQANGNERLLQAYEIYDSLANGKIEKFKELKQHLSTTLEELLAEGKIGPGVVLASRIKAPASVVDNWRLGKDLYDIFGITLLTTDQKEMEEIQEALEQQERFNISSKKKMNEKRGYEAIHFIFNVGDENEHKTMVECHMQTHEAYKNVYPHIFYKVMRKLRRDLTKQEEKEIAEKVQSMYQSKQLFGMRLANGKSSRLPQMWVTSFNQQGKMEEQELTEELILTIMYPFLDISKRQTQTDQESQEIDQEPIEL